MRTSGRLWGVSGRQRERASQEAGRNLTGKLDPEGTGEPWEATPPKLRVGVGDGLQGEMWALERPPWK